MEYRCTEQGGASSVCSISVWLVRTLTEEYSLAERKAASVIQEFVNEIAKKMGIYVFVAAVWKDTKGVPDQAW